MAYLPIQPPRTRLELSPRPPGASTANTVLIGLVAVAVLYFAREVLVPIALAILLSFALAPLVRLLRNAGVPRLVAVLVTVIIAFAVILGIGAMMARQATQLAENLPRYQTTIGQKVQSLRGITAGGGIVARISKSLSDLQKEMSTPASPAPEASNPAPGSSAPAPLPVQVQVQQAPTKPLELVQSVLMPILAPLATTGIVIIFAIFILLYRQDLRDRFIRLAGTRDLHRTTEAMDDAATRLSRYFLTQTAINAGFGVIVGTALLLIGVPNPVLWGVLGALLRFVPYVGPVIAAVFPAALAIAVSPGWSMFVWTVALFVVVEGLMGQVIEPWLYGHRTGLSPVAVIVAATFWTWLWGPVGLLLSTPLTVCLVVLGRHVEPLGFLEIMLGDEPALSAEETFYQRMLAGDPHEAADQAELILKTRPLSAFYDDIAMQGLALAQADLERGLLDLETLVQIRDTANEVIEDLSDHLDTAAAPSLAGEEGVGTTVKPEAFDILLPVLAPAQLGQAWQGAAPVLCVGGRSPLDEAAATMLAQLLEMHGIQARCEPRELLTATNIVRLDPTGIAMVCLSYVRGSRPVEVRYLVRRLRRRFPAALILTGLWRLEEDATAQELHAAAGGDLYATTLRQAVELCMAAALELGADAPATGAEGV